MNNIREYMSGESVESKIEREYQAISSKIKDRPNMSTRYLSIGFSRDHNATFMNQIAQFGSSMGNFIFIDSYEPNY